MGSTKRGDQKMENLSQKPKKGRKKERKEQVDKQLVPCYEK